MRLGALAFALLAGFTVAAAAPASNASSTTAVVNDSEVVEMLRRSAFPANYDASAVHIVFSVGCTQEHRLLFSAALLRSAARVGQRGPITQIVSGCTAEQEAAIRDEPKFYYDTRVHFTPAFHLHPRSEVDDWYAPYNKPFGLRHFLQHADPPLQHEVIALVDYDFLFFKPLEVNTGRNMAKNYKGTRDPVTVTDEVRDGVALAQDWRDVIRGDGFFGSTANRTAVCNETEPCSKVSDAQGWEYYWGLGPPYVMTRNDMNAFVDDYCHFAVQARKITHDWHAEMYGYSIAAANHGIMHTILTHLGVTHPYLGGTNEYWSFLDLSENSKVNPCEDPFELTEVAEPPVGMHYHQYYRLKDSGTFFYKREVPKEIVECSQMLFDVPKATEFLLVEWLHFNDPVARSRKRHEVWAECSVVKALNQALVEIKERVCVSVGGYNSFRGFEIKK